MARVLGRSSPAVVTTLTAIAIAVVATSLGEACLDPTQITLKVKSNVPCGDSKGVALTGGVPGAVERAAPSTITTTCNAGDIGTLVSTPSGDKESRAAFLVVQGIDRPASECAAAGFKGCIVARRILRYIAHTPLELPIALNLVCKDVACGEFETCARSGKCVSAVIEDPESCPNGVCVPPGEEAEPEPTDGGPSDGAGNDGSGGDGSTTDGGGNDGGGNDGSVADARPDAPPTGVLFCPPVPGDCPAGQVCCWQRQSPVTNGRCLPTDACPLGPADLPMRCNRKTDCPAGQFCCGTDPANIETPGAFPDTHCALPTEPNCKFVCFDLNDCPFLSAAPKACDLTSGYFTPQNEFGICRDSLIVKEAGVGPPI
ncbi:MAG: hypothetical protein JST00_29915 [Deltaproteobacteria bacterium]|nr:hypothetical protein [Deltaproteobacteria bacterium]